MKCTYLFKELLKLDTKIVNTHNGREKEALIDLFNEVRELALQAREDLIIHRQAVGFTFQNQKLVEDEFPLPGKKVYRT